MIDRPTHKMIDGKRVDLTEEECEILMKEWENNLIEEIKRQNEEWINKQRLDIVSCNFEKSTGITIEDLKKIIK